MAQSLDHPAAHPFEQSARQRPGDHQGIFVPHQAIGGGFAGADIAQYVGAMTYRRIAHMVTITVVDCLEPVEIDDGQRDFINFRVGFGLGDIRVECTAIGQPGQAVAPAFPLHRGDAVDSCADQHRGSEGENRQPAKHQGSQFNGFAVMTNYDNGGDNGKNGAEDKNRRQNQRFCRTG